MTQAEGGTVRLCHDKQPAEAAKTRTNGDETLGYIISGKTELVLDGETVTLKQGESYRVP